MNNEVVYKQQREIDFNNIYESVLDEKPENTKYIVCVIISDEFISIFGDKLNYLHTPGNKLFVTVCNDYKALREDNKNIYLYNFDDVDYYIIDKKLTSELYPNNKQLKIKINEIEKYKVQKTTDSKDINMKLESDIKISSEEYEDLKLNVSKLTKREFACIFLRLPNSGNSGIDKLIYQKLSSNIDKKE